MDRGKTCPLFDLYIMYRMKTALGCNGFVWHLLLMAPVQMCPQQTVYKLPCSANNRMLWHVRPRHSGWLLRTHQYDHGSFEIQPVFRPWLKYRSNRDAGILSQAHFRVPSGMIPRERYLQNTRLLSFESVAVVFGECSARFYYLPYPVFSFQNHQSGNHHLFAGGGSFFLQIPQSKLNRKEN